MSFIRGGRVSADVIRGRKYQMEDNKKEENERIKEGKTEDKWKN